MPSSVPGLHYVAEWLGPARYEWRHGIAARKSDPGPVTRVLRGRRVSVTFRTIEDGA